MFKLTYRDPHDRDHSKVEYFDDIKSLGQALINIVDNEKEEQSAMEWCGRAHWGDKVVRQQFGYKIECFSEEKLKNKVEQVVKELCDNINKAYNAKVGYSYVGWDNDALTWDLNLFTSWVKYRDDYGYYIVINDDNYPNGMTELFSCTDKNVNNFLTKTQKGIEDILINRGLVKSRKNGSGTSKMSAQDVVNNIKKAEADGKEWHGRIYEDNCWWADVERHPYGQLRFWVGFEDKRSGRSRASIVTLAYLNDKGDLRYCTDGIQIKQVVWNKIQSTAKALIKAGILKL